MKTEFTNDINAINAYGYEAIVIGVSAGGFKALNKLYTSLTTDIRLPIIIVQHRLEKSNDELEHYFQQNFTNNFKPISDKQAITPYSSYIAPAGYHLLIEADKTFALSVDDLVSYSRPSIDVLFNSAAEVYKDKIIGIVLTGANCDGSNGLLKIKQMQGLTLIENPQTSYVKIMPKAALSLAEPDYLLDFEDIIEFILSLT